jgi:hypothetical protein
MSIKLTLLLILSMACAQLKNQPSPPLAPKDFSQGELIMGTQLLAKIFDEEMAPLECVPDSDEAALLLRTIQPRMEVMLDELESKLDNNERVDDLIKNCPQSCSCPYIDDVLREHQVGMSKSQQKMMQANKSQKQINRCLNYMQETFCKSELYQELNKEKAHFSFEE